MFATGEIANAQEYIKLTEKLLRIVQDTINLGIEDGSIRNDLHSLQASLFLGSAIESAAYIPPEYKMLLKQFDITPKDYLLHSMGILLKGISSTPNKE